MKDEPAYMLAARLNVKDGIASPAIVVEALLKRIDRLEAQLHRTDSGYLPTSECPHGFHPTSCGHCAIGQA